MNNRIRIVGWMMVLGFAALFVAIVFRLGENPGMSHEETRAYKQLYQVELDQLAGHAEGNIRMIAADRMSQLAKRFQSDFAPAAIASMGPRLEFGDIGACDAGQCLKFAQLRRIYSKSAAEWMPDDQTIVMGGTMHPQDGFGPYMLYRQLLQSEMHVPTDGYGQTLYSRDGNPWITESWDITSEFIDAVNDGLYRRFISQTVSDHLAGKLPSVEFERMVFVRFSEKLFEFFPAAAGLTPFSRDSIVIQATYDFNRDLIFTVDTWHSLDRQHTVHPLVVMNMNQPEVKELWTPLIYPSGY